MIVEFSKQQQELEELTKEGLVIVDYYATWCGPCKVMSTILRDSEAEFELKNIKVVKVDIDERRDLALNAGVQRIPMFDFYQDGEKVNQKTGILKLIELIEGFQE